MLTYAFTDIGKDSLYEYLYKVIKKDIESGVLKKDERLPSKRNFAKHLDVSVITIENAYAQLISEGYVYSLPKKGFFVAGEERTVNNNDEHSERQEQKNDEREDVTDLLSNDTMRDNFPFSVWAKLMRDLLSEKSERLLLPSPPGGIMELRTAIAEYLKQFRGMHVQPEQIIVGAGTEYLYGLLIQLLGRDKTIALENPGYSKIGMIYERNEVNCEYIAMDQNGMNINELIAKDADIVHISPSHHFPTGIVTPLSRRYELMSWAVQKEGRYIIEDDYDCEFRMRGKPVPPLQCMDIDGRVIYMNTFTKTLTPTIRISFMVLPEELLNKFYAQLGFYNCTVSNFEQFTLARFIQEGYFEKHINRMRIYYREQRDKIINTIKNSRLGKQSQILEEDAGLHFLLKIDTELSDAELVSRAADVGIRLNSLSEYYHGNSQDSHTLVINYSGVQAEKFNDVIQKLNDCLWPEE